MAHDTQTDFFKKQITRIFAEKKVIIDIGGGLRIDQARNNRYEEGYTWIHPYLDTVDYKVLDKVSDFNPDIVGDIHALPLPDESVDAIVCIAVLEHVEEPQKAVREMHRVLKPGGYCFIFAPFLYYYHAEKGYYGDFYRFTEDGMWYMTKEFSSVEIDPVRGPITTLLNLIPFFSKRTGWASFLDRFARPGSKQVSGCNVFCIK